jgi:hypothetical protein
MNILIIYQKLPDSIEAYLIDNYSKEELKVLELANNTILNTYNQNQIHSK